MRIQIQSINFLGKPSNYGIIDNYITRSAQPQKEDFVWLKEQGVTDIFNFRNMIKPSIDFDEKEVVESLGMKYHQIPSRTRHPNPQNIEQFLSEIDEVIKNNGKAHIHCKAGADRTGMYAFVYKMKNHIGTIHSNIKEWMNFGHHYKLYPDLMKWTVEYLKHPKTIV